MTAPNIETLFETHKNLIKSVMRKHHHLLAALRLEDEDVEQDLSVCMLSAIEKFDSERSASLPTYLVSLLRYAILDMKQTYKPHGMSGIPQQGNITFLYLNAEWPDCGQYEMASFDDTSNLEVSEFVESLSDMERETLDAQMNGFYLRRKTQKAALSSIRSKYTTLYENGRMAA